MFFIGLALAFMRKPKAADNYWGEGATTLEWTLPSPPEFHSFEKLPEFNEDGSHYNRWRLCRLRKRVTARQLCRKTID